MTNPLARLRSVSAKVTWIVTLVSGLVVLALSTWTGVRSYQHLKQRSIETVASQARIVAVYSSAPLAFGDREMAAETLAALRVVEDVERATLVDRTGRAFAEFAPRGQAASPAPLYPPGRWPRDNGYVLVTPVRDRAGVHGRLQVEVRNAQIQREATLVALQTALLSVAAIVVAWWLARLLHPLLTRPIIELDRAARHVRDTGDYGVRVRTTSSDELGTLTESFNEMLERIETSQRELIAARQRAEEASRLKDEFVATVSHELRTPLSPILAWIQILRMPQGPAGLDNALDVMERNARALTGIINDLLDMSRIVSGTLRLTLQPVAIDAVVRASAETLESAAQAKGVDLQLDLAATPQVLGDPARLQQVICNLLSNAIKFSERGTTVQVSTRAGPSGLELEVRDEGLGITPDFLPYVFDRFRQQDGSITRAHGGLGLGLSIVRQLVELHGGAVCAASGGPGQGSTFVVTLPLPVGGAGQNRLLQPRDALAELPRLDGIRVLLVEDHADMRAAMASILEAAGARVAACSSAADALAAYADAAPDVLISDIGLPDIDGYQLLQQVRDRWPATPAVPAIAVSAYVHPDERQRSRRAGFVEHLGKPVNALELVQCVAAACRPGVGRASA